MADNDPESRFRRNYPGFLIGIGLFTLGHIVYQLATGQASVGGAGGPLSYQNTPMVFAVVLVVEAVIGGSFVAEGIRGRKRRKGKGSR